MVGVESLDEAISIIKARPSPLTLYGFTSEASVEPPPATKATGPPPAGLQ